MSRTTALLGDRQRDLLVGRLGVALVDRQLLTADGADRAAVKRDRDEALARPDDQVAVDRAPGDQTEAVGAQAGEAAPVPKLMQR